MNQEEALELLRGGESGIGQWHRRVHDKTHTTDLRGVDLSGAKLATADLSDMDLRGAILEHADLTNAHLSNSQLQHAKLRGAILV